MHVDTQTFSNVVRSFGIELNEKQLDVIVLTFPGRDKGSVKKIDVSMILEQESEQIKESPNDIENILAEAEDEEF